MDDLSATRGNPRDWRDRYRRMVRVIGSEPAVRQHCCFLGSFKDGGDGERPCGGKTSDNCETACRVGPKCSMQNLSEILFTFASPGAGHFRCLGRKPKACCCRNGGRTKNRRWAGQQCRVSCFSEWSCEQVTLGPQTTANHEGTGGEVGGGGRVAARACEADCRVRTEEGVGCEGVGENERLRGLGFKECNVPRGHRNRITRKE